MKPANINHFRHRRAREGGQTITLVMLALGLFLLGAVGIAVDVSNWWFHRQMAHGAADAACVAGAMDLLVFSQGGTWNNGFTPGTAFDCTAADGHTGASPCAYAALNGYNSVNSQFGNLVSVSFPASVPGVTPPPSDLAPFAFIRVDVLDHVQTNFTGLLSGNRAQDVRAFATCGVVLAQSPIPIIVLDPQSPASTPPQAALNIQGNGTIAIVGGPSKSIQVDSSERAGTCGQSNCSVNLPWGSAKIDLSKAGPNGTGADMGLTGAPFTGSPQIPTGFIPGTTGHWVAPASPVSDPFAQVCYPGQAGCPAINGYNVPVVPSDPTFPGDIDSNHGRNFSGSWPCSSADIKAGHCYVSHGTHGCPDPAAASPPTKDNGCVLYTAGAYPSQIKVKNSTAVFDPGLYYVTGGVNFDTGSTVRPGTGTGDGSQGVTFYLKGSGTTAGTVTVDANSGKKTGLDPFYTRTGTGSMPNGIKCTSGSSMPDNVPDQIPVDPSTEGANILLGPCTGYYGDPLGGSDPLGIQRGFLFFQDRSGRNVQPSWGGGGQFLLSGTMYFHSCNATGSGVGCGTAPTYYNDIFSLIGNSGSGTYVLGSIVTDNLTLGGTSGITMDLNPTKYFTTLKATLLQ